MLPLLAEHCPSKMGGAAGPNTSTPVLCYAFQDKAGEGADDRTSVVGRSVLIK